MRSGMAGSTLTGSEPASPGHRAAVGGGRNADRALAVARQPPEHAGGDPGAEGGAEAEVGEQRAAAQIVELVVAAGLLLVTALVGAARRDREADAGHEERGADAAGDPRRRRHVARAAAGLHDDGALPDLGVGQEAG